LLVGEQLGFVFLLIDLDFKLRVSKVDREPPDKQRPDQAADRQADVDDFQLIDFHDLKMES
jgi:hypothetical protein